MTLLNAQQQQALDAHPGKPLRVVDPRTNAVYVLIALEQYEPVKALFEKDDFDIRDTYPAQLESAMRAGWNDPAMDAYNDYDKHRPQP